MKKKDTLFNKIVKPILFFLVHLLYRPTIIGKENLEIEGPIILAGNHTKWLDPIMLVAIVKRQVHFLAKIELFKGPISLITKGMGAIPVNRKIHDKKALETAITSLKQGLCIGIFPEGTINRTNDLIMPFKIGAVKMSKETNATLIPFVITGKYKLFRKSIKIEFLKPLKVSEDLEKSNQELMKLVEDKIRKEQK